MNNDYTKLYRFVAGTFAGLGVLCISSAMIMPNIIKFDNNSVEKIEVLQQRVSEMKSNEIKLKNVEVEMNSNLSLDVRTYLENPEDIDESILERLKLDISNVNTINYGNYTYTITYNKKIYNGTITVKQKELPKVDTMTLNPLELEINTELPTDISRYVKEQLSDEVKAATKLDLSNVNNKVAGRYLYSISYNGKFYTSTITIYEPNTIVSDTTKEENKSN